MNLPRLIVPCVIALSALASVACAEETDGGSSSSDGASASRKGSNAAAKDDCGTRATDDCTPHVGPNGSVRVDALIWRVTDVRTAKTLGKQEYGLGAKADGRFVIVSLRVTSDRDESATLTQNVFQLEVDGNTYDPDTEGTVAAIGAGEEPFFFKDIGPDVTATGTVVFDVPESVLDKKVEMRFNELGFGSTRGYIRLPHLRGA